MGKNFNHARLKKRIERSNTKKIVNKLLRSQTSAKRNFRMKNKIKNNKIKNSRVLEPPDEERGHLKFGSININGIDMQKHWAIKELIKTRGFDVSDI